MKKKVVTKSMTMDSLGLKIDNLASSTDSKINKLSNLVESLAISTAKGFANTASKDDLNSVKKEFKNEIKTVNDRLDNIDFRLGRIESDHSRRLDNLEDKIRIFSTIFEKNLKIKLPK